MKAVISTESRPLNYQVGLMCVFWLDLPQLTTLKTGKWSFFNVRKLCVNSLIELIWLNRSSSTSIVHYRVSFFLYDRCIEYDGFGCDTLSDWIFLSWQPFKQEITPFIMQDDWVCLVWLIPLDWLDLPQLTTIKIGILSFNKADLLSLTGLRTLIQFIGTS